MSVAGTGLFIAGKLICLSSFQTSSLKPVADQFDYNLKVNHELFSGSVWVYGAWEEVEWKDSHREEDEYCSPWVYWVAFCDITIITALLLIALFSGLVWGLLACCVKLCCKGSLDETTPLTAKSDSVSDSPA